MGPFLIVVVGDGDSIDSLGLDLPHHLFSDAQGRRLEIKGFPYVGMQVQLQLHRAVHLPVGFDETVTTPIPSAALRTGLTFPHRWGRDWFSPP